jgi:Helix-turn-helix domain
LTPERSQPERTRREDRHSNFYEISDNLARAGRIPHVRLGRYRRFRESAVEEWLRELETGGATDRAAHRASPLRRTA